MIVPKCPACKRPVEIRTVRRSLVASCCAGSVRVQLGFLPVPMGEPAYLPLSRPAPKAKKARAR